MTDLASCYATLELDRDCSMATAKQRYRELSLELHPDKRQGLEKLPYDADHFKKAFKAIKEDIREREESSDYWNSALSTDLLIDNVPTRFKEQPPEPATSRTPDLNRPNNLRSFVYVLWLAGKGQALTSKQILYKLEQEQLLVLYEHTPLPATGYQCVMKAGAESRLVGRVGSRFKDYKTCIVGERQVGVSGITWRLTNIYWDMVDQKFG